MSGVGIAHARTVKGGRDAALALSVELKQLQQIIDGALCAEEAEEPESEETGGGVVATAGADNAVAEACLARLQKAVASASCHGVQNPADEQVWDAIVDITALGEPAVMEELVAALERAWQLAAARDERRQDLGRRLVVAEAESRRHRERADRAEAAHRAAEADVGEGEKADELLASTLARLTVARKTLKEREWELTTIRRRLEDYEEDRLRYESRLHNLETALEKATAVRIEGAQRLAEASSQAASILSDTQDAQRRLLIAEQEGATASAAQTLAEHRAREAQEQLEASRRRVEELEIRLREVTEAAAADEVAASGRGRGPFVPPLRSLESLRPPAPEPEAHLQGVGIVTPTPRRALRSSLASRGGAGAQTSSTPSLAASSSTPGISRLVSPARLERQGGQARASVGRKPRRSTGSVESQAPTMPTDLRSLGKLLTGGGLMGNKR